MDDDINDEMDDDIDDETDDEMAAALALPAAARRARTLLALLRASPQADLHTMIKALQQTPQSGVPSGSLIDPLTLFRCHWLTHNALYRLRDRLWRWRCGHVEIGPLTTTLQPYRAGAAALTGHDPLRAQYLDSRCLFTTGADDVVALLGRFWTRAHAADARGDALATLGLNEAVDHATIKQRYRRLAMRHHPDRGGSAEILQAINDAMRVLDDYYGV